MSEADFQTANFKLREREFKYFAATHADLPAVPDLSDMSGGLSNPAFFNFVFYIAWKVVSAQLPTAADQDAFSARFGSALLDAVAPGVAPQLAAAAAREGAYPRLQPGSTIRRLR